MDSQSAAAGAQYPKFATSVAVWLLGLSIVFAVSPLTAHARWYDPERGMFLSRSPLSPTLEHQYAFTLADPINFADPTGLWEEDVHRGDTYLQCIKAGGSQCTCHKIADADQGFDEDPATGPWRHPSLHFPQELGPIGGKLLNAISACDAKAFGAALHQYQDYFAHVYTGNAGSGGFSDLTPPNHLFQGHDPDYVDHHTAEWDLAMNSTFNWVNKFLQKCGDSSGSGGGDCSQDSCK